MTVIVNVDDFIFARRGVGIRALPKKDAGLLQEINVIGVGKASALLLLHGFGSSPAVYRELIPQITKYDAIVCPTLPGHGTSIEAFGRSRAADWAAKARGVCAALCEQYESVDVVGLSLGGVLAYQLAEQFTLNHLYLFAPAFRLTRPVWLLKLGAQLLLSLGVRRLRNRAGNLYTSTHEELTYRQLPLSVIIELLSFIQNIQPNPLTCPVDLFLGQHDEVVDSDAVARLFQGQETVTTHWLKHSAHVLPLDGDIQMILDVMNALDDNA